MIQQHFIRSPSLREKLNDRFAGLELISGMIIAIVIILAIFFISTIGGQILFFLLLLLFVIITMCIALICWIDYRKRELKKCELSSSSSSYKSDDNCHLYGIRFISLSDQV
ncbi:hypothetical protein DERP_000881 [Dermatophagoides pteronyssinus]|uniref:Uncharacterized protein n=1 Tax=Dermatophagoides pteronyssinus TaxID=6956 RepID=A0ABQ8J1E6_DERPT|nr:hypothetical protein DERP_000881 [Dermatophagoides pteronyssinus]